MYISEVSGHHQATVAIEKSLRLLNPDVQIMNINGFGYVYPIMEKIINKAYMGIIKRTPKVWDYLYDNPKIVKGVQSIKEAIHKANHAKLSKLFNQFQPDVVVCTQAFPCGLVADYKMSYGLPFTLIGVLTDYAPHSYWIQDGVDYYIVPSPETADRLASKGVLKERIKSFGIPVDPKFTEKLDRESILKKLKLDTELPTVLIMGGGQGLGPIKDTVKSLLNSKADFQLVIVAGTNKKLIRYLKKIEIKNPKKMVVCEYVDNIDELMEIATLAITKPGGMTTTEALVKNLPMVIVKPIPGQEAHNTEFLLEKGAALRVNRLDFIGKEVESLLQSPQRLAAMRQAACENSRPHSSFDIAKLILHQDV